MIQYVPIPVFVNGKQCNKLPQNELWDHEDDVAWYRFGKEQGNLCVYNLGAWVDDIDARHFGTGGTVVTKVPLVVNMARNAIIEHKCTAWKTITESLASRFSMRLKKARRLDPIERARLLDEIVLEGKLIDYATKLAINKIRFIPDIFGELQTPLTFFEGPFYTLFDGKNTMVAERVQSSKRAFVVMPSMFVGTRINPLCDHDYYQAIFTFRQRLGPCGYAQWVDFDSYVKEFDSEHTILDDKDLGAEDLLVLNCLRAINGAMGYCYSDSRAPRRLVAGVSDRMSGWTDGHSFIAIHQKCFSDMRYGGAGRLVSLLIHEYTHGEQSLGEHVHDHNFYHRFHDHILKYQCGRFAQELTELYVSGICKLGIVPSSRTGRHVRKLAGLEPKLASRLKAKKAVDQSAKSRCRQIS